jgi:hypothetical protein
MEASMTRVRLLPAIVAIAVLAPPAVSADPYSDLSQSFAAFNAVHSWHATEQTSTGQTILVDHVAPDRWRIQPTSNTTEILIGNDVYMNGQRVPIPGSMIRSRLNNMQMPASSDFRNSLKDLGWQSVNGVRAHAYSYTVQGVPETLYVGTNHLPIQAIVKTGQGTMTITYSQYNAPITISP